MKNIAGPVFFFWAVLSAVFLYDAPAFASSGGPKIPALKPISRVVQDAIRKGQIPGAVVLIGREDHILYRKAFGFRQLKPGRQRMTLDTIFDLASLTKVVATTTAVMQLAEQAKLDIDAPVVQYWPEFGINGKDRITIRDLLTHYSGLRPDLDGGAWSGEEEAISRIIRERPVCEPRSRFIYSDINFGVLGVLVRIISGMPLDAYCLQNIFLPLGMKETFFNPQPQFLKRIAPTVEKWRGSQEFLRGEVHDPTAGRMGGVAGHAGLFATADDLALFARMILHRGQLNGVTVLDPATVAAMTARQSPAGYSPARGFGWNMAGPLHSNRLLLPAAGTCWHTGYTGTALWIDTVTKTYVIVLTNRVHPKGRGDAGPVRKKIIDVVARAMGPASQDLVLASSRLFSAPDRAGEIPSPLSAAARVRTGIDALAEEKFAPLIGKRVGLITNHTGVDARGVRTIDLLRKTPGVKLAALFSPEHGISGAADERVGADHDDSSGLEVISLYGDTLRPTSGMLEGIDALVFDVQDAGVRFYTYIATMAYAMEAAAGKGIPFFVLDRPDPLGASTVQGPVMDRDMKSFTGYFPMPVRHGMTIGELASMFNGENALHAELHVVKMRGYRRSYWFDETGLPWINPSPNLRSLGEAALYPGVAMVEGSNVSVGRGTDSPFELLGAPWIMKNTLSAYLNTRQIGGVRFIPVDFTPVSGIYAHRSCHGVRIILEDREALDSSLLGIEITAALVKLYPRDFQVDKTIGMIGSRAVLAEVKKGGDPKAIARGWQKDLERFMEMRKKYLLY